jgi:hypothetical protein
VHLKNKLWKIATAFVVLFLVLNPETIELAIFINTIGLELFLMLLEAQVLVFLAGVYGKNIKRSFIYLINICTNIIRPCFCKNNKKVSLNILYIIPSSSTLMNLLVFSAILSFAINVVP